MAKKRVASPRPRLRRTHRLTLTLNEREYKAIIDHCESRRIASRTGWMREVIMPRSSQSMSAMRPSSSTKLRCSDEHRPPLL